MITSSLAVKATTALVSANNLWFGLSNSPAQDSGVFEGGSTNWSIESFLANLRNTLDRWFGLIVLILGIIMLFVGIYQIARGLMGKGNGQTNWLLTMLLVLVGGLFSVAGGWNLYKKAASGAYGSFEDMGKEEGSINHVNPNQ